MLYQRRKRCVCCKQLFVPDPRNRYRQRFCSDARCQVESKAASQRRWHRKPENRKYWRGTEQVDRVRVWRRANPNYWRRAQNGTLQDDCIAPIQRNSDESRGNGEPLQDDLLPNDPLIVGLIAEFSGRTLQENIAVMCHRLITKGREILRTQKRVLRRTVCDRQPAGQSLSGGAE